MKRRLTALLLVPLVAGCAKKEVVPPDGRTPTFDSVEMHRSACYGPCPVYTVHIASDGVVVFEGEEYVSAAGKRKRKVERAAVLKLNDALEKAAFSALKEKYQYEPDGCTEVWTDASTVDIIVTTGTSQHRVTYYYGCKISVSQVIDDLSKAIDLAAGTADWVGASAL